MVQILQKTFPHSSTRTKRLYIKSTTSQCAYNVTYRRVTIVALSITYSECVCVCVCVSVALVIQHAKRMRGIILLPVACLVRQCFSTLSHKRYDFREKVTEYKMGVLIFSTICLKRFSF